MEVVKGLLYINNKDVYLEYNWIKLRLKCGFCKHKHEHVGFTIGRA